MLQRQRDVGRLRDCFGPNQDLFNFVAMRHLRQCILRAPVLCPETAAKLAMGGKGGMRCVGCGMTAKSKMGHSSCKSFAGI